MRQLLTTLSLAGLLAIPGSARSQHAFDDLPVDDPSKRSVLAKGEDPAKKIRDNIFIVANVDHPECYAGQQVLLTYKLYTALQSTSTVTAKPILNNFIVKERKPGATPLPDKTIDGKRYHGFTIWQALLTPLHPGEYTVDPLKAGNDVSYTATDGKTAHYSGPVASHRTTIDVRSLPAIDRPAAFHGLVGKWQIQSRLTSPRTDSSGNDTLLVEIAGSGSFENITSPYMRWPAGFRHMEPIQHWDVSDSTAPQTGRTTIVIPFTASTPGEYSLPPMELAWFDPIAGTYHTKSTDSLIVHVLAAPAPPASTPTAPVQRRAPPGLPSDISQYLIPLTAIIILTGIILLFGRRRKPAETPPAASPPARIAPEPPKPTPPTENLDLPEIKQTLIQFLQAHLQSDAWAEEDLLDLLEQKDPSRKGRVQSLLDDCNQLLYSPQSPDPKTIANLNRRLKAILQEDPSSGSPITE